jgi:hypothetical protein
MHCGTRNRNAALGGFHRVYFPSTEFSVLVPLLKRVLKFFKGSVSLAYEFGSVVLAGF